MTHFLEVAVQAAQRAARIQLDYRGKARVEFKSNTTDLVTEADRLCEKVIHETLSQAFPDHGFVGEESGEERSDSRYRWIVDPIDGTTNYAHGVPLYAVSIALADEQGPLVGVVYAAALDELFTAERGKGAFLNGQRLQVSKAASLEESLLVTGFPYDLGTGELRNLNHFRAFTVRTRGVRRLGSAAIDLAWVAAGRLDGFWELDVHPWDVAAGVLLVQEAGGKVTTLAGEPFIDLYASEIVASNGHIHEAMLQVLQGQPD